MSLNIKTTRDEISINETPKALNTRKKTSCLLF